MRNSRSLRCAARSFLRIFVRVVTVSADEAAVRTGQLISPELLCHIRAGGPRRFARAMPKVTRARRGKPSIRPTLWDAVPAMRLELLQERPVERAGIACCDVLFYVRIFPHS